MTLVCPLPHVTLVCPLPHVRAPTEDYSLIYASPEYINSMNCNTMKALTPKSDVFSFAKVCVCVWRRGSQAWT